MIEIIEAGAVEATNDIHYIIEDNWLVKCPLLRYYPTNIYLAPFSSLYLIIEQIIEPLLAGINTTKNEDGLVHDDGGVSIARLRPHSFEPSDFKPELWWEAVLVYIIHGVMTIPSANDKHRVVADNSCVAKSIQRLGTGSLHLFPLIFLILQSAAPQVIVSRAPIIASEDIHGSIV